MKKTISLILAAGNAADNADRLRRKSSLQSLPKRRCMEK